MTDETFAAFDEIIHAAIAAHADPVPVPEGPDPYRYADADRARRALIEAGFAADSVRVETVQAPWAVPSPEFPFEAHMRAGFALPIAARVIAARVRA